MAANSASHSWVWTVGASAVVAGAIFSQQVVFQVPVPPEVGSTVRARQAPATPEQAGTDAARAVSGARADAKATSPDAAEADPAIPAQAATPVAGPAPATPDPPAALNLREASALPWTVPHWLLAEAGSTVDAVQNEVGVLLGAAIATVP